MPNKLEDMLEGVKGMLMLVPETVLYIPFDFVTVPARNKGIPLFLKMKFPQLSCRGYTDRYSKPDCKPAIKYHHKEIFAKLCRYYNPKTGCCNRYSD
ncbi:hypothetical protein JW707_04015 [Candidatus Woesearchaeota archaeon]|nr:hypothetical protein [Candidatus Woesearchaeota archaeon]